MASIKYLVISPTIVLSGNVADIPYMAIYKIKNALFKIKLSHGI